MDDSRRRLICRRIDRIAGAALLAPMLYCSCFLSAAFLYGAGWLNSSVYLFLCSTVFRPMYWIDGDGGRIEPLFNLAFNLYIWGDRLTH